MDEAMQAFLNEQAQCLPPFMLDMEAVEEYLSAAEFHHPKRSSFMGCDMEISQLSAMPVPISSCVADFLLPPISSACSTSPSSSFEQLSEDSKPPIPTAAVPPPVPKLEPTTISQLPFPSIEITVDDVDRPFSTTKRYPVQLPPSAKDQQQQESKLKGTRGRKRAKLMQAMSGTEREKEIVAQAERNRQSARECRRRKKAYILSLEKQVEVLKQQYADCQARNAELVSQNTQLIEKLRDSSETTSLTC